MCDNQNNGCDCRAGAPHPPVRVDGQNPAYACEVLSNMAGLFRGE